MDHALIHVQRTTVTAIQRLAITIISTMYTCLAVLGVNTFHIKAGLKYTESHTNTQSLFIQSQTLHLLELQREVSQKVLHRKSTGEDQYD